MADAGTILFVCTGNTCRSPMAAALARLLINDGVLDESSGRWNVLSAGVGAAEGSPATPEAVLAVNRLGADLSTHRSQPLTPALLRKSSLILTMSPWHAQAAAQMDPAAENRIIPISPFGDVPDPIGQGQRTYDRTAEELRWLIEWRLKQLRDGTIFDPRAQPGQPPPR